MDKSAGTLYASALLLVSKEISADIDLCEVIVGSDSTLQVRSSIDDEKLS